MAAGPTDFAARGLSAGEVAERVRAGRTNAVPVRSSRGVGAIVRANVLTRFNALIGTLFVVILLVAPVQDSLFGLVVVANTGIGIVQEWRAKRTLDRLALLGRSPARVVRDGRVRTIPPDEVVLDDALLLGAGDKVVVDGEVLRSDGLEIDESLLTGEQDPVARRPGDPVMSGSFAVAGSGVYRATRVGRASYASALAEEAARFTLVRSELRDDINRFLAIIGWLVVPTAALLAVAQFTRDGSRREAVSGTVAGIVTMVPEGLVLLTSIAFAVGVVRLGRRDCLVQELPAIEGLARVDTVCVDKTGTLTEPGMALSSVRALPGDGAGPAPAPSPGEVLAALAASDPRPNASMRAVAASCPDDPGWTVTGVAPFSAARAWSGATFGERGAWVLGAPDVLLRGGGTGDPDGSGAGPGRGARERVLAEAESLSAQGLRVLLLARAGGPLDAPDAPGPVEPRALVALEQVVRPGARGTLGYFEEQGVEVLVVSGDNASTVGAVAARLGLPGAADPVDARSLPDDPDALAAEVDRHAVFGRVAPHHKQALVGALHARGRTVAMTGDGVNDVLALKDADVGVAMGSGSDAAHAVAQIVLLDDRFETLPVVVAEGRRVVGNIERVAGLFLTKTVYAVLLALAAGATRVPFPFLPRHLTLVGALTIGVPAFFLALAPNAARTRSGMVARVLRFAVPAGTVVAAAAFGAYYAVAGRGRPSGEDRTVATVALALAGFGVLTALARPLTWWRCGLVGAMVGAFAGVLALPALRDFFALPLPPAGHLAVAAVAGAAACAGVAAVGVLARRYWS